MHLGIFVVFAPSISVLSSLKWYMINILISHGMYFSCCIFMPCSEPLMDIACVGSLPLWGGGSVINFPALLGVGN